MKKLLFGTAMTLVLMVFLIPNTALAEGGDCSDSSCSHEAAIGNQHYTTLEEAVSAAAPGATITVIHDVELAETLTLDKTITIIGDTPTRQIMVSGETKDMNTYISGIIIQNATVTLKDLTFKTALTPARTAMINIPRNANSATYLIADGLNVSLQGSGSSGNVAAFKLWAGKAEINNCIVNCSDTEAPSSAMLKGFSLDTVDITITNTTITGAFSDESNKWSAGAIEIWKGVNATIDGCSIDASNYGIVLVQASGSSTVTVRDTEITDTSEAAVEIQSDYDSDYGTMNLTIESGSFNGAVRCRFQNSAGSNVKEGLNLNLLGGDYSKSVAEYVDDSLNYESISDDNRFTYHSTLASAMAAGPTVRTLAAALDESTEKGTATVILAPDNGTTNTTLTVTTGETITLPTLADNGYWKFQGWSDGDTTYAAGQSVAINKATTLTAQWHYDPPYTGSYNYAVTLPTDLDNGSVTVAKEDLWATDGEKITITVTPDAGYMLDTLTITDKAGNTIAYTDNGDGTITFTMPAAGVTIDATFVEDPDYEAPTDEPETPTLVEDRFVDVAADAWYRDAVQFVVDHGIMTGTSATTFEPQTATTRAMIVSMLHRLEDNPAASTSDFTDVAADSWYHDPVAWAAANGIVGGYEDGTFQPNRTITREELASILYRYAQYKGYDVSARADLSIYTDAPSPWAADVMAWANAENLITGRTATTIDAQSTLTRAECAAIFQRFLSE